MRAPQAILLTPLLSLGLLHCGGCEPSTGLSEEGLRVWGRHKIAAEIQERAERPIDAYLLETNADERRRVLEMTFDEAVARFGFLRFEGTARFNLSRNGHRIPVFESTVIEHGLHGSFRVLQKDKDGDVTRELVFNNDVLYLRNGAKGKMRVQGTVRAEHRELREQAWAPLRTFTAYFGERLRLVQAGVKKLKGRTAVRYRMKLGPGPDLISVPGTKGRKKPVALSGALYVDEKTAVPILVKLQGELQIPGAPDAEPGVLKVFADSTLRSIKGVEIKPEEYVPTIAHRPVDLEPLKFLEGDTRTSTVIRGR